MGFLTPARGLVSGTSIEKAWRHADWHEEFVRASGKAAFEFSEQTLLFRKSDADEQSVQSLIGGLETFALRFGNRKLDLLILERRT